MGTQATGTLLGIIPDGETLAGWEIIATGDGGAIAMKSGSCWCRYGGWEGSAAEAWEAVTARLWQKLSDTELSEKIEACGAESARRYADGRSTLMADAALNACIGEFDRRQAQKGT